MLDGPLGGAAFNNEFGRPNLAGRYFRTLELAAEGPAGREVRGYHKPIMLAGGFGNIRGEHVKKTGFPAGAPVVVLGGPAMLIGLGGGAASSVASGASHEDLDFGSVQRDNAEMQRRCQEVIDASAGRSATRIRFCPFTTSAPGGLSNALPELVNDAGKGAAFELRKVPNDEPGMSPLEIWCNESQERYVLARSLRPDSRVFRHSARVSDAPTPSSESPRTTAASSSMTRTSVIGPIDMPLSVLLGKPPKMHRRVETRRFCAETLRRALGVDLREAILRVLQLPSVADKTFLITIGDRSVTGLVARDQMVGPWQVPVADAAVTAASYDGFAGEAMAMVANASTLALLDAKPRRRASRSPKRSRTSPRHRSRSSPT